MNYLHDRA